MTAPDSFTPRVFVSICAASWIISMSMAVMLILILGWISPTHDVLVHMNDYGEMIVEIPLLCFLFSMFLLWSYFKYKEMLE